MLNRHNILAVDDEKKILDALKRVFLDGPRINLIATTDPKEAIRIVSRKNIDPVISDQRIPGMTGTERLKKIIEMNPDMITIILPGYSDVKVILEAINELDVYKFVLKPWKNEELFWTVIRALEMKEMIETNRRLNRELKKRNAYIRGLESEHPGITKVKRDSDGVLVID